LTHPYLLSILGISIPYFWLGQIMLIVFAIYPGLFPTGRIVSVRGSYEGVSYYLHPQLCLDPGFLFKICLANSA
jgi:ABC-type dipeptide/oligopeptide/nickel transport system permease component